MRRWWFESVSRMINTAGGGGGGFFFFKQKTAYEMLRSLVGSDMCIRDRGLFDRFRGVAIGKQNAHERKHEPSLGTPWPHGQAQPLPLASRITNVR